MKNIVFYDVLNQPSHHEFDAIANFLFLHLEEYGDPLKEIKKSMDYALKFNEKPGGLIAVLKENEVIISAIVINKTGMSGYIPENILVYIATHVYYRGKGIGKQLMKKVIKEVEGNIALHVEPNNPAKYLYEKLGFTNPYLEMRLIK